MSMDKLRNDIKQIDRALDNMAQAACALDQADDWVSASILVTLEGMIDDAGERLTELRGIRDAMVKMKEEQE